MTILSRTLLGAAAAAGLMAAGVLQASAQDCTSDLQTIEATLPNADVTSEELAQINSAIMEAQAQLAAGDEAGCQATIAPVLDRLGISG